MNAKDKPRRILLMSDTHGHLDASIMEHVKQADEVWHAGDIGNLSVLDDLMAVKPLRIVHGNIDDGVLRREAPEHLRFRLNGLKVWMTHIGGYANRLPASIRTTQQQRPAHVFICGHSHICRVGKDKSGLLCLNPGAAGHYGIHLMRTMLRFTISSDGQVKDLAVIELGKRGQGLLPESAV
ncbi:MAG: metallophosphoesterase family protein [Flavobacteriales bacterium]|jgi:putative phosphoesterase|tara:strand:- start:932 stop:1474 length:543 start_codon:yes stop_codon:yes gene_type:complete